MKRIVLVILFFMIGSMIAETCDARGRLFPRRRTRTNYTSVSYSSSYSGTSAMYTGSDQQRAYAEAKYMSINRIRRHVGANLGNFEGWGYGGPNCATCTPSGRMTLTADAHYGNIRIRVWR